MKAEEAIALCKRLGGIGIKRSIDGGGFVSIEKAESIVLRAEHAPSLLQIKILSDFEKINDWIVVFLQGG